MLNIYTSGRVKRRVWSPTTIALSIGAHVLLLGGVIYAAGKEPPKRPVENEPVFFDVEPVEPKTPPPPAVEPPPTPQPPRPTEPVKGDFVQPVPPTEIPSHIPEPDLSAPAITEADTRGIGRAGDVIGPPDPEDTRPPTGNASTDTGAGEVFEYELVEERPALRNAREMQRVLQRLYPPLLQETGITGQTTLQFVVDAEGNVEPGSINVVSTTHEGFREASVKAAEKFKFRPAKVRGRPVRVLISLPIAWTVENR
jgi:protein TonB